MAKKKRPPLPKVPEELEPRQMKAARLLASGIPKKDVARLCGVTVAAVNLWMRNTAFRAYAQELVNRHTEIMEESLLAGEQEAVQTVRAALLAKKDGEPDWDVRLKAAFRFLDSAGMRGKPAEKTHTVTENYQGDITDLLRAALNDPGVRPLLAEKGIIDVDYEVLDETGEA